MKTDLGKRTASLGPSELLAENDHLRLRLQKAEQDLNAIRSGGTEGASVPGEGPEQLRLLTLADRSYRLLMEEMTDGGLIANPAGLILFVNRSMAAMLKAPPDQVVGSRVQDWITEEGLSAAAELFRSSQPAEHREVCLRTREGARVPVYLAASQLPGYAGQDALGILATDLSGQYLRTEELADSEKTAREQLAASDRSRLALLSVVEDQSEAERSLRERTQELSELYELSRALAAAETLRQVLEIVGQTAVRMVHVTFARMALLDGDQLVVRSAHPVRVLEHELLVGESLSLADAPHCVTALETDETVLRAG